MSDGNLHDQINALVATQHELRGQLAQGQIPAEEGQAKLRATETELDRLWDLVRQEDAKEEFPDAAPEPRERSAATVEDYLD